MKKIQTILIDPFDQSLSYIDIEESNLQNYYSAMQCSCFDIVSLGGGVIMYVTTDCALNIQEVLEELGWLPEGHVEEPFMKFIPIN